MSFHTKEIFDYYIILYLIWFDYYILLCFYYYIILFDINLILYIMIVIWQFILSVQHPSPGQLCSLRSCHNCYQMNPNLKPVFLAEEIVQSVKYGQQKLNLIPTHTHTHKRCQKWWHTLVSHWGGSRKQRVVPGPYSLDNPPILIGELQAIERPCTKIKQTTPT